MNDMRLVIVPKSDQMNADDLLGGSLAITITKVEIRPGTEQPVSIHFAGDNGKPYKPCKSMSRVLVSMWGPDANNYVGRSLTLYSDPSVLWGGMKVGGIRISHLSDIAEAHTMALTATKGSRKPFTVRPMSRAASDPVAELRATAAIEAEKGVAAYLAFWKSITSAQQKSLLPHHEALKATAKEADAINDPFGLPPADTDAAAPADGAVPVSSPSAEAPQERQQPARNEAFWARDDYEIAAPHKDDKKPDWHGWGERMVALIDVAKANELEMFRSHNNISRRRCLEAADPKIVANVDAAFAAAEKRTGG